MFDGAFGNLGKDCGNVDRKGVVVQDFLKCGVNTLMFSASVIAVRSVGRRMFMVLGRQKCPVKLLSMVRMACQAALGS